MLPFLERLGRSDRYKSCLDTLAQELMAEAGRTEEAMTFDTWCSAMLSDIEERRPPLPARSTPEDAPAYAQGYLEQRLDLQPGRPALARGPELQEFCWDYHQGRLLTWNVAGNDPRLSAGMQLGIKDRRALILKPAPRTGSRTS